MNEKLLSGIESGVEAGIWFSSAMLGAIASVYIITKDTQTAEMLYNWVWKFGLFIAVAVGLKVGWINKAHEILKEKKFNEIIGNQKLILKKLENKEEINKEGNLVLKK